MPVSNPSATYFTNTVRTFSNILFNTASAGAPLPIKATMFVYGQIIGAGVGEVIDHTGSPQLSNAITQINTITSGIALGVGLIGGAPVVVPAAIIGAGVGLVGSTVLTKLYNENPTFKNAVDNFENSVSDVFNEIGKWAGDIYADIGGFLQNLPADLSQMVDDIHNYIQDRYNDLSDALNNLYPGVGDFLDDALSDLGNTLHDLADDIKKVAEDFGDGLNRLGSEIGDAIDDLANLFLNALGIASPIVLDLDGDGLELVSLANSKTYFDIDNDLFAERTGWVKGDDGFLVRDLNGNGKIDNQGEMFGDNGGTSAYAKLAALDSNNDKKITSADAAFTSLRIWQDKNQNGAVDTGELKTLSGAGITSLNTASTASTATNQGHKVAATSTYTKTNGTTGNAADIFFQKDDVNTWYVGDGTPATRPYDMEALYLPQSRGYGKLASWADAISQNDTLKNMAIDFVDDWGVELNPQALQAKVEAFMFEWAGVSGMSATSRGVNIDARKLAFIEKMMDQAFLGRENNPNPGNAQAIKLM